MPDGDLFAGISSGKATMVTDEIASFDGGGVVLASGDRIDADVVVTATGFQLSVLGGIEFTVDGEEIDLSTSVTYRGAHVHRRAEPACGCSATSAPAGPCGPTSWAAFACRLLDHMDELGVRSVTPRLRPEDADMRLGPWIDPANFDPGYLRRSMHLMPHSGDRPEWQHSQDYWAEREAFPAADLDDGCLVYG